MYITARTLIRDEIVGRPSIRRLYVVLLLEAQCLFLPFHPLPSRNVVDLPNVAGNHLKRLVNFWSIET